MLGPKDGDRALTKVGKMLMDFGILPSKKSRKLFASRAGSNDNGSGDDEIL